MRLFPISSLWQSIGYRNSISIRLGLNFNQAITNNAMILVPVLSAKVGRNEQIRETLDIGNMFGPTFGFKNP